MALIADGILIACALTAAIYCAVLSTRLKRLANTEDGIGSQIATLNTAVEETRTALAAAQERISGLREESGGASERVRREMAQARRVTDDLESAAERARSLLDQLYAAEDLAQDRARENAQDSVQERGQRGAPPGMPAGLPAGLPDGSSARASDGEAKDEDAAFGDAAPDDGAVAGDGGAIAFLSAPSGEPLPVDVEGADRPKEGFAEISIAVAPAPSAESEEVAIAVVNPEEAPPGGEAGSGVPTSDAPASDQPAVRSEIEVQAAEPSQAAVASAAAERPRALRVNRMGLL
ncbi:MAG: hypothetical protein AAF675_06030 [Pseudomonadota bacterium]